MEKAIKDIMKSTKGFSMGETILAIFVVSIGITAMIGFIANSILNSMDNRDAIIGAGLSQEGIELMRNLKDSNLLQNQAYDNDMSGASVASGGGCISPETNTYLDPNLACSDFRLYYSASNMQYQHTATTAATKFSRKILFTAGSPAKVSSVVWWGTKVPAAATEAECNLGTECTFTTVEFNDLVLGI